MKNMIKKNIPNAITCINVIGGTLAIIFASDPLGVTCGITHYGWAWLFIALSMLADFMDGFAARLLHVKSEMGKELDSLCDIVSFGIAPAVLIFNMLKTCSPEPMPWWIWLTILIAVGAALRLAKFNLDTRQTTSFLGMPVPANAMFWIGYSAALAHGTGWFASPWVFIPILAIVVWLMNSELPLISLKVQSWNVRDNAPRLMLILGACSFIIFLKVQGLMWFVLFYLFVSLIESRRKAGADKNKN